MQDTVSAASSNTNHTPVFEEITSALLLPSSAKRIVTKCMRRYMPIQKLTNEVITAAILGFEEQKRRIDGQIADLRALLSGGPAATGGATTRPRGRRSAPPSQ